MAKEEKRIQMTILGKTRDISLDELIELYKSIDDPSPDRNARASFSIHKLAQERKEKIEKAHSSPEAMFNFVWDEINSAYLGYDYGMDYTVSPIPEDVYGVAEELPIKDLERIMNRLTEGDQIKRFQRIIDAKKEKEREEKKSEGGVQKKPSKDDSPEL